MELNPKNGVLLGFDNRNVLLSIFVTIDRDDVEQITHSKVFERLVSKAPAMIIVGDILRFHGLWSAITAWKDKDYHKQDSAGK